MHTLSTICLLVVVAIGCGVLLHIQRDNDTED